MVSFVKAFDPGSLLPTPMPEVPVRPGADIEAEFRTWYYTSQVNRAHASLNLALLLVFASVGIDLLGSGNDPQEFPAAIKLLLIVPLLLITMRVARDPAWRRYFPHFMCASIIATGIAFSVINLGGNTFGISMRYDALVLVTVFTYFLGGLASTLACGTGLALLGLHLFLSSSRNIDLDQMAYESLFLLAINGLGMLSANFTERSVRDAFWRFQTMTQLSELDPLTQLCNRRGFDRRYSDLWDRARREAKPIALAFVDLDHFKNINDQYGHDAGDEALRQVGSVLTRCDPAPDLCARLGGDELVAAWFGIERPYAETIAARLPRQVEALGLRNEGGAGKGVLTISVGLTLCQPGSDALPGDCLRRADQALYGAKQAGRNRIAVA